MDKFLVWLREFLVAMPAVLLALSFHEFAHGFVSWKLGDPTARNFGRLTLNPLKHIDPLGFICMALFHFGWAKPVPVNARYYKKPRLGMALTAAAGPAMNLLLGFFGMALFKLLLLVHKPHYGRVVFVEYHHNLLASLLAGSMYQATETCAGCLQFRTFAINSFIIGNEILQF